MPRPLPHHPGNIFLTCENISLSVPGKSPKQWSLTDVDGSVVRSGEITDDKVTLGKLGTGFYRIMWSPAPVEASDTALAVIEPLTTPTPSDSPICIQTWLAGFYTLGKINSFDDAANLAALAGINGVRDATAWTWLSTEDGNSWIESGNRSAESLTLLTAAYAKAGLKLLLTTEPATPPPFQCSANWGARPRKKFPTDYRDYAAYVRHLVGRTATAVEAYEAWNEPEGIGGGYIGSEAATAMKVFRLAARSVNPTTHTAMGIGIPHAESLERNDYVKAVDSYHYHAHKNAELTRQRRRAFDGLSGNRPVWVTESSYGSYPLADTKRHRMTPETESRQAADIAKLFTRGLHDGNDRLYYFSLLDTSEEAGQAWGVLMTETLEPRPAYVALSAAGRLLAGAKPLGSIQQLPVGVEGWLVESLLDGVKKKVAVLWKNDNTPTPLNNWTPESVWDIWGRKLPGIPSAIGPMPLYLVLKPDSAVAVSPPPKRSTRNEVRKLEISPVVADFRRPDRFKSRIGDFFLLTHLDNDLDLDIYNFSPRPQKGLWSVESTDGLNVQFPEPKQNLDPGERATLRLRVRGNATHADGRVRWIQITGRFGDEPASVLTLPVVFCPEELVIKRQRNVAVTGADATWRGVTPPGTRVNVAPGSDWTTFTIELGAAPNTTIGTTWATATYALKAAETIPPTAKAVTILLRASTVLPAGAQISLTLIERSGAAYSCALPVDEKRIGAASGQRFTLPFSLFVFQSYRKPFADESLNLDEVVACELTINAMPNERASLAIGELAWVLE